MTGDNSSASDLSLIDQADKKINLGLDRIKTRLEKLRNPQDQFEVIHIAGTNGKGSVVKFLELMYLEFKPELRIAKFTSPHLISCTERISVKGKDISEEDFKRLYSIILKIQFERSQTCARTPSSSTQDDGFLTEFEKITCVAFMYFKEQGVNLAILETGLGGRLDATNICERKLATAITNISMDHMDYLGDSIEKIRKEKEGIKRDNVPHFEGEKFKFKDPPNSIKGQNFLLALEIFESLNDLSLSEEEKRIILNKFRTESRARFDLDSEKKVLVDGAHNPAAAQQLANFIKEKFPNESKTFIIAMLDKDFKGFIEALLPCINLEKDRIIFTKINSERSLDPKEMARTALTVIAREQPRDASCKLRDQGSPNFAIIQNPYVASPLWTGFANDLESALETLRSSPDDGLTVITGSLYLAGEYYSLINSAPSCHA